MLRIPCIHCGARDENEFVCGGSAHLRRPGLDADDQTWAEYLFFRDNPKGGHRERWRHAYGCGAWFNVLRDTVTHEILAVYAMGEDPP